MKFERTIYEDDLARFKDERDEADRRYNEALTALDQAVQAEPDYPHPPPPPDDFQVTPLNERWNVFDTAPPVPGGWRGRIVGVVWQWLAPVFERQQAFNSALVDHVNRNLERDREVSRAVASTIATLESTVHQLVIFQHRLIGLAQQFTAFIDTKDREFHGLNRRVCEDAMTGVHDLDHSVRSLTVAIRAISGDTLKHVESLTVRVQRDDSTIEQLRATVDVLQQHTMVLKREFARLAAPAPPSSGAPDGAAPESAPQPAAAAGTIESWKYVGFEDLFRGPEAEIRRRLEAYVPLFAGAADVLDVGCGRGEFLDLLRDAGVSCRGLDLNHEMVEVCRARGHDVAEGDALGYLESLPDASLGGLIATQVVEHLAPDYLLAFLDQAQRVLRPGAMIALETINVACWTAFFESYIRDITHVRPLHPDTLQFLVRASGFADATVRYSAPVASSAKLKAVPVLPKTDAEPTAEDGLARAVARLAETTNENTERLNGLLFGNLDYAVIARRP